MRFEIFFEYFSLWKPYFYYFSYSLKFTNYRKEIQNEAIWQTKKYSKNKRRTYANGILQFKLKRLLKYGVYVLTWKCTLVLNNFSFKKPYLLKELK